MKRNGTLSPYEVEVGSRYEKEWNEQFHGWPAIDLGLSKQDIETAMKIDYMVDSVMESVKQKIDKRKKKTAKMKIKKGN